MSMSNYLRNAVLDRIFRGIAFTVHPVYVSLHTASPGITGANELSGGSGPYARVAISTSWDAASGGATQNAAAILFTGLPGVTVTHVGVWDASSGGNFLWGGALDASVVVASGESFNFSVGDLDVSLT